MRSDKAEAPAARRGAPREEPEQPPREQPERLIERSSAPQKAPRSRRWLRWVSFAVLPLALIAGGYWYVTGGRGVGNGKAGGEARKVGLSRRNSGMLPEIVFTGE